MANDKAMTFFKEWYVHVGYGDRNVREDKNEIIMSLIIGP